jgi:uncharacterized repeat protein (TIGR03803 family)
MKNLRHQNASRVVAILALILALAGIAIPAQAQSFTLLHSFAGGTDGSWPMGLAQGTNGYLYGTTEFGGANNYGTVFKISTSGTETILDNPDVNPSYPALTLATNGDFYGAYSTGSGTLYKVTPSGVLTVIAGELCQGTDCGSDVTATLMQASNGDLYGTTEQGGLYNNSGFLFKVTTAGDLTVLHNFCETQNSEGECLDGHGPFTQLVEGTNGILYGMSQSNGNYAGGTIFQTTLAGDFKTLYTFCSLANCADGAEPKAALVQGPDGNFYGVTSSGGTGPNGTGGTFFTMTPAGAITTLYNFCTLTNCADGDHALALTLGTDGNFYGMTGNDGANGYGTIFQITPSGTLTTEHNFDLTDGWPNNNSYNGPELIQDTNGTFYGTTEEGGANYENCSGVCNGTVFSLSMHLGPFVETLPVSGKVGSAVKILGTNLTGSTSVTFNGVAATFKVASSTEITTTVPTGATTGVVKVVTSKGTTLTSNLNFTVP